MKRITIIILLIFFTLTVKSQISEGSLIQVHPATTAEMNALHPNEGALIYNTTENSLYVYNGTVWEKHKNSKITTTTTRETINVNGGNQVINVRDASKIVGFTLISSFNNLAANSGKMSGTWIINDDRDKIRCLMQSFEHPYIKYLVLTVQVRNGSNTIRITQYNSRFWKVTDNVPQAGLSNNGTDYSLDKIVVIRKE